MTVEQSHIYVLPRAIRGIWGFLLYLGKDNINPDELTSCLEAAEGFA